MHINNYANEPPIKSLPKYTHTLIYIQYIYGQNTLAWQWYAKTHKEDRHKIKPANFRCYHHC